MDQTVFVVLTGMVLLGKFADFLMLNSIGKKSDPSVSKDAPVDQIHFLRQSLSGAHKYIETVFKIGFFNRTRIVRVAIISAFLVQGSFIFSALIVPDIWVDGRSTFPFADVVITILVLVSGNFVFDLVAISIILWFLEAVTDVFRNHSEREIVRFTGKLLLTTMIFYLITVITMSFCFSLILHIQGVAAGYRGLFSPGDAIQMHLLIFENDTIWRLLDPYREGQHLGLSGVNLFFFCFTPLLAPALVLLVASVGAVLDLLDAISSRYVSKVFHELANSEQPFFLKLASVLAFTGAAAATLVGK